TDPKGVINLSLLEAVPSASAPPLVARTRLGGSTMRMSFDLSRVGNFVATIFFANPRNQWQGSMQLIDPHGVRVAGSTTRELRCPIPLSALGKSRDAVGNPRLWALEVTPHGGVFASIGDLFVTATVRGEGRISTAVLQERIQKLLGPHGHFIELIGENSDGYAKVMLTIKDVVAAETIDMH